MTQTKVYTLEAFIGDVQAVFASTKDPRAQAQGIAKHLTDILAVPGWLEEKLESRGPGALDLHIDEKLGHPGPDTTPGFKVMCSLSEGTVPTVNTPHDHGAGFVVYGVYQGENEHTTWRWTHPEGDFISTQLTADKTFTLSPGTRDIVSSLDDLLTIELFQSKEPPVEVDLVARDVSDFLKDLASGSGDNVKLIHRFPDVDDDDARKAQLAGIPPVQFNVQTANGLEIKNGYLGVVLTYTNLRESIPFVQSIDGFEYRIATLAYGMVQADVERKTLGFLAGHGEKTIREDLSTLVSLLAQQYEIREVTAVDDQAPDLSEIDVLIIAGPTQRMAEAVPDSIRAFLASGGKAMIMIDPVVVDQQSMFAIPNQFHFGEFVEEYGVVVEDNLVFDLRSNETLSFNTARGNIFLPYQYWARVLTVDKKVAGQVESVLLPWASSIGTTDSRVGDVEFIPLLRTTPFGVADYTYGDVSPNNPSLTNPNSRPFENDIGVAVEGSANGESTFRLIVIGDSDWLTDPIVGRAQENLAMGLNLVDWLAQEDALADIRSKVITTRALIFDSPAQRNIVQYANILGLPLLFIMLGAVRYARRRRINLKVYSSEE
ncbi:MAG: GldG family protein [Chloroflexi bacterium]|nr:GldG family protein [Chloroflexota bacterium]